MVYSGGKTVFLRAIDVSDKVKSADYLKGVLKEVIEEVSPHNVVQVVTDNAAAYVKAGKTLTPKYNLCWTPCAALCINLIFEDIGKRTVIKNPILASRKLTKFIYNHGTVLAEMQSLCKRKILCPGTTRFATNYLALKSSREKKGALQNMFTSEWWDENTNKNTKDGRDADALVLDQRFWTVVDGALAVFEPLYDILRFVDAEIHPAIGMVYRLFEVLKDAISQLC